MPCVWCHVVIWRTHRLNYDILDKCQALAGAFLGWYCCQMLAVNSKFQGC